MTPSSPAPAAVSVLFVDKVFLKGRGDEPPRGVEVFNLNLVRDLAALGHEVTFPLVASWADPVRAALGDAAAGPRIVPDTGVGALNALGAALRTGGRRYDVLLLANVGRGLLPLARLLRARRRFERAVVIAHREATPAFVRFMRATPGHVVAVNEPIARPFREAGHPSVHVDYGVVHADRFTPRAAGETAAADGAVHFCVLGMLDNAWKGADTALAAFRLLPDEVRTRCRLHLASYREPAALPEPEVTTYAWMPSEEIPAFLRRMDVLVVPSRDEEVMRETFSQAVVQGMLTGLPVLVNDLPVLTEKIDRGGGQVWRSPEELAAAMQGLADDPALRRRLGAEGRAVACDRYVWDSARFARRYLAAAPAPQTDAPA